MNRLPDRLVFDSSGLSISTHDINCSAIFFLLFFAGAQKISHTFCRNFFIDFDYIYLKSIIYLTVANRSGQRLDFN